jgi:diguanylate cyclase (GGDEF)-like protein
MSSDNIYHFLSKFALGGTLVCGLLVNPAQASKPEPLSAPTHHVNAAAPQTQELIEHLSLKSKQCQEFANNAQIQEASDILLNELKKHKDDGAGNDQFHSCLRSLISASMAIESSDLDLYIPLAEKSLQQDEMSNTNRINLMFSLGLAYYEFKNDFQKGLDLLSKAQIYIDENKDKMSEAEYHASKIMSLRQQAILYWSLEDWKNAELSYRLALDFNKKNRYDLQEEAEDWYNLAITLLYGEKYREAYNAILKNIDINHRLNSPDVSGERGIMNGIIAGHALGKLGEFGQAEHYFKDAVNLSDEKGSPPFYNALTHSYYALFKVYEGDFIASEYQLKLVDDILKGNFELQLSWDENDAYLEAKYKTLQHLGDYENALSAFQRFHNITIDGFKERESKHMSKILVEHEAALSRNENKTLLRESEIKQLKLLQQEQKNQKLMGLSYGAALLLLGVLAFFIRERHMHKKMIAMTKIDQLTATPNRKTIMDVAHKAVKSTHDKYEQETSLAIGLLDIDNFKRINDTFGHDVGDIIIRDVVDTLRPILRSNDHLGRYGGEEFLLLLPNADAAKTEAVFKRLQDSLNAKTFQHQGQDLDVSITLSMGAIIEKGRDDVDLKDENIRIRLSKLIKVADDMLHKAKQAGRNQLVYV